MRMAKRVFAAWSFPEMPKTPQSICNFHCSYLPRHWICARRTREFDPWRFVVAWRDGPWNFSSCPFVCWPCRRQVGNSDNPELLRGVSTACKTGTLLCCNSSTSRGRPLCCHQGSGICTPARRCSVYDVALKRDESVVFFSSWGLNSV